MAGVEADGYRYEACLSHAIIEFHVEAEKGLTPLTWCSLGGSKTGHVMPLRRMARKLSGIGNTLQEQCKYVQWLGANSEHHFVWMCEKNNMGVMEASYWKKRAILMEQARHYGMQLCRAFFRELAVREHLPPKEAGRLPQTVLELVESFLNF